LRLDIPIAERRLNIKRVVRAIPTRREESMTHQELLDREAIRHTMARYTIAGDRLRLDDFLSVFTEDAIMESEGVAEEDAFHYEGTDQIAGWITRWTDRAGDDETSPHRATFVRHHLATSLIEFAGPDTARARTYWMAYTDIGPDHCGYYLDTFRRQGEQWLIAHRRVRLDWRSPQSLFTTAVARTR
jgi:hypothetical protein